MAVDRHGHQNLRWVNGWGHAGHSPVYLGVPKWGKLDLGVRVRKPKSFDVIEKWRSLLAGAKEPLVGNSGAGRQRNGWAAPTGAQIGVTKEGGQAGPTQTNGLYATR